MPTSLMSDFLHVGWQIGVYFVIIEFRHYTEARSFHPLQSLIWRWIQTYWTAFMKIAVVYHLFGHHFIEYRYDVQWLVIKEPPNNVKCSIHTDINCLHIIWLHALLMPKYFDISCNKEHSFYSFYQVIGSDLSSIID